MKSAFDAHPSISGDLCKNKPAEELVRVCYSSSLDLAETHKHTHTPLTKWRRKLRHEETHIHTPTVNTQYI